MKYISFIGVFILLLAVNANLVNAETVLRMSDSVTLSVDQVVDGDFYGLSFKGPVSLSGTINGDAEVVGSSITLNGTVDGDLFALGGSTQLHASVTDDVRVVSGETTIAGPVGGDVVVLGGILTILSTAQIEGNVYFYGGEGEINGIIIGSVFGSSNTLRIDGPVGGDVNVNITNTLTIGDRANIDGNLTYKSPNEIIRGQNTVVVGDIVRNSFAPTPLNPRKIIAPFLMYAFSVLIFYAIFRRQLQTILSESLPSATKMGLIGLVGIIFLPVSVMLLFVTIIGMLVGLAGLTVLISLYLISFITVGIFMGLLLSHTFTKTDNLSLIWVLAGILLTEILFLIPFLGPIILLAMTAIIFGTFLYKIYSFVA